MVKVRLSDFTRVASLTLNAGEDYLASAVLDAADGYAYFGTDTTPGRVVKVRLSDFTRVTGLTLAAGEDSLSAAVSTRPAVMPTLGRTPRRAAWSRCACPISRGWPA